MIQTLMKNWWLLAACGVLDAACAVTSLFALAPDGSLTLRTFAATGTNLLLCRLSLAAGACTVAGALWKSGKSRSWLLALNGAALGLFGFIPPLVWHRRVSFLPFALLLAVAAIGIVVFAWRAAFTLRRHFADRWFLRLTAAAGAGFAVGFLVLGFGGIRLEPQSYLLWMSSWFGFCALCMLALSLRLNSLRIAVHRLANGALPAQ